MRTLLAIIFCFCFQAVYAEVDVFKNETKGVIESINLELRVININGHSFTLGDKLIIRDGQGNTIDQGILKSGYFISFSEPENNTINSITIQSRIKDQINEH